MGLLSGNKTQTNTPSNTKNDKAEAGVSIIASGMTIIGDIESNGNIRIEGKLIGKLVCRARVSVGAKGRIDGSIDSSNAHIEGEVTGAVVVRELLQLQESARIYGDIITARLTVQDGAIFTGNIKMGKEAKEQLQNTPVPNLTGNINKLTADAVNNSTNGVREKAKTLS